MSVSEEEADISLPCHYVRCYKNSEFYPLPISVRFREWATGGALTGSSAPASLGSAVGGYLSADPSAHEALHELPLEQQESDQ